MTTTFANGNFAPSLSVPSPVSISCCLPQGCFIKQTESACPAIYPMLTANGCVATLPSHSEQEAGITQTLLGVYWIRSLACVTQTRLRRVAFQADGTHIVNYTSHLHTSDAATFYPHPSHPSPENHYFNEWSVRTDICSSCLLWTPTNASSVHKQAHCRFPAQACWTLRPPGPLRPSCAPFLYTVVLVLPPRLTFLLCSLIALHSDCEPLLETQDTEDGHAKGTGPDVGLCLC